MVCRCLLCIYYARHDLVGENERKFIRNPILLCKIHRKDFKRKDIYFFIFFHKFFVFIYNKHYNTCFIRGLFFFRTRSVLCLFHFLLLFFRINKERCLAATNNPVVKKAVWHNSKSTFPINSQLYKVIDNPSKWQLLSRSCTSTYPKIQK